MAFSWAEQRRDLPILATVDTCRGATFIVTGANANMGLEVAKHLVRLEAKRVILAVRNLTSGQAAANEIGAATGRQGVAEAWKLDLADFASIKAFASRATEELDRVDGVAQNAAVAQDVWTLAEGLETNIAVNVIGNLLLAVLLMPKLSESAKRFGITPRVTLVTSSLGWQRRQALEKVKADGEGSVLAGLNKEQSADMNARYGLSKLVLDLAVLKFVKLIPPEQTGVVVNLLTPGVVKSSLARDATNFMTWFVFSTLQMLIGRTPEMGSRTILHAVTAGKETHGSYLSDCKNVDDQVPGWMTDAEGVQLQESIWKDVSEKLEEIAPGCLERIL